MLDREGEVHERGARLSLVDRDLGLVVLCTVPDCRPSFGFIQGREGKVDLVGSGLHLVRDIGLRWCNYYLMGRSSEEQWRGKLSVNSLRCELR